MSRSLYLPYKSSNPRSIRGAKKRGWHAIKTKDTNNTSWLGKNMWCERVCAGYWISSFMLREFAFEKPADATAFAIKFGEFS